MSLKSQVSKLPDTPGVYQFFDERGRLIYVGKAINIKKRVSSYFTTKNLGPKTNKLVSQITDIKYLKVFSEFEALLLEAELIRTNQPFFNIDAKDDKSPLYIKIENREVPIVGVTRREKSRPGVSIYGPFPSAKTTRMILRDIRHIFPYCSHKKDPTTCLYAHLGLCPYPYQSQEAKDKYKLNIKKIKDLLSRKSKKLISNMAHEMNAHSKAQNYEEANRIKQQMEKLKYLATTYRPPRDFLERPTLVDDLTQGRLKELAKVLSMPKVPRRIECYDISNIQGTNATGSMVVFTNGKPDKGEYRRFKIKLTHKPNDYEMLREVAARRFKNKWPTADLMVIDGGKGQLSSVLEIKAKYQWPSKIVSLAKRFEEIYTEGRKEPIRLSKENPARQLVQALRDEAHRFAITYHRLLRSKEFLTK